MRRAAIVVTAILLAPSAGASGGTLNRFPNNSDPAKTSDNANQSAPIISIAPAYSTDIPALVPNGGQPAAGVNASSSGTATPGGVPNGTMRTLLSPPSAGSTSDN